MGRWVRCCARSSGSTTSPPRCSRPPSGSSRQPGTPPHTSSRPFRPTEGIHHMRKVYAGLFSSLDGVVEAPNEWQPGFDEEMGAALSRMLDEQDAVLLGRVTFTEWASYWPTPAAEPFASRINGTPTYVASRTLDSVAQWPNSTLIKGPVADFVAELRQQGG